MSEEAAKQRVENPVQIAPPVASKLIDDGLALQLQDGFETAWRKVSLAINTAGFTVIERNRGEGRFDDQDVFGEEFGVKELLMLEDIRVKAMIAGALADMPEFLIDQIGKASNSSNFPSMTRAMERIADVVEEKWEEERE